MPNWLTLSRALLALVFFGVLVGYRWQTDEVIRWRLLAAAAIFSVAAATDALDGYLARKWRVVSIFGRIMDPFADKFLVLGAFMFLAGPGFALVEASADGTVRALQVSGVAPWMAVAILARELLVTSIRGVMESRGVSFAATWSGKLKMILQSTVIPAVLVLLAVKAEPLGWTGVTIDVLVWATVIVSIWSGVPYVVRAMGVTRRYGLDGEIGA